jgi:hypothetical protein
MTLTKSPTESAFFVRNSSHGSQVSGRRRLDCSPRVKPAGGA